MVYRNVKPSGGDTGAPLNLRKRFKVIQKYINLEGTKILDCGCGTGQYLRELLGRGADAYGIEYDSEKVILFKREFTDFAERIQSGNIETMDFPDTMFDAVLLNEVLEHVSDEIKTLQEILRVLKPGGTLLVFSPNRFYPFETHSVLLKKSGRKVPLYLPFIPYLPISLGERFFTYRARNYWPGELRSLIRKCGYKIIAIGFIWQTFENISGSQPKTLTLLKPVIRRLFAVFEQIPLLWSFGVSQVVIAQK